jgi:hypothetical protein
LHIVLVKFALAASDMFDIRSQITFRIFEKIIRPCSGFQGLQLTGGRINQLREFRVSQERVLEHRLVSSFVKSAEPSHYTLHKRILYSLECCAWSVSFMRIVYVIIFEDGISFSIAL